MKSWVRLKLSSLCETHNCLFCWKILKSFFSLTLSLSLSLSHSHTHSRTCTHTHSLFLSQLFWTTPNLSKFHPWLLHHDEPPRTHGWRKILLRQNFFFKLQPFWLQAAASAATTSSAYFGPMLQKMDVCCWQMVKISTTCWFLFLCGLEFLTPCAAE